MQIVPVLWHEISREAQGEYKKKVQPIGMEPVGATGGDYYDERRRKEGEAVEEGQNQWHGWPVRSYDFAWHDRAQPHLAAANGHVFRVGPGWPAHAIPLPALCVTCHGRFRHGYRGSHRSDAGGSYFAVRLGIVGRRADGRMALDRCRCEGRRRDDGGAAQPCRTQGFHRLLLHRIRA